MAQLLINSDIVCMEIEMKLEKLLQGLNIKNQKNIDKCMEINCITDNSKKIKPGNIYICLKGVNVDGHEFAQEAKKNGAVCVVVEHFVNVNLPQIVVDDCRKAFSILASNFYDNPTQKLTMIGVTGTNGKTTTASLIYQILNKSGLETGLIGTLGTEFKNKKIETNLTTPDPMELFCVLCKMQKQNVTHVVMEVSAHAIALNKIWGIKYEIGVLTNFSQDHLDFFKDMQTYEKAKESFFCDKYLKRAVVNFDDELGQKIYQKQNVPTISFGIKNLADCFAQNIKTTVTDTTFVFNLMDNIKKIKTALVGVHNVQNAICAGVVTYLLGLLPESIFSALKSAKLPEGRFNVLKSKDFAVIVDFAHTPEAMKKLLEYTRKCCKNNVITVFGCSGNHDTIKRPKMGAIAEQYSDFLIITSDNPRFENPNLIYEDIKRGLTKNNHLFIKNRVDAIKHAVQMCKKGDALVICGKGGEKHQDINGKFIKFCDAEETQKILDIKG